MKEPCWHDEFMDIGQADFHQLHWTTQKSKPKKRRFIMKEKLQAIREEAMKQIQASDALDKLNDVRVSFLGKKEN